MTFKPGDEVILLEDLGCEVCTSNGFTKGTKHIVRRVNDMGQTVLVGHNETVRHDSCYIAPHMLKLVDPVVCEND